MAEDLRALLRLAAQRDSVPTAVILDSRTLQSTPESGGRGGDAGAKKRKGSKVPAAGDTLGHLLALKVTAANEQERAQVGALARAVQAATGENVQLAYVDQGYTGAQPAAAAVHHGLKLEVVKHHKAKRGLILLPRRWVVERRLRGRRAFAGWRPIMNGSRPLWPDTTGWPSRCSCSNPCSPKVHDRL